MLREIIEANQPFLKIETAYKGYSLFDKEEIQDMVDNPKNYQSSDNLPKWLEIGVWNTRVKGGYIKRKSRITKVVNGILRDILNGEIKQIDFKRDQTKAIFGFQNVDVEKYL